MMPSSELEKVIIIACRRRRSTGHKGRPCSGSRRRRRRQARTRAGLHFVSQTASRRRPLFVCATTPSRFPKNYDILEEAVLRPCPFCFTGTPVRFVFRAPARRSATGASGKCGTGRLYRVGKVVSRHRAGQATWQAQPRGQRLCLTEQGGEGCAWPARRPVPRPAAKRPRTAPIAARRRPTVGEHEHGDQQRQADARQRAHRFQDHLRVVDVVLVLGVRDGLEGGRRDHQPVADGEVVDHAEGVEDLQSCVIARYVAWIIEAPDNGSMAARRQGRRAASLARPLWLGPSR